MRSRANTGGIAQNKVILPQRIVAKGHSSDWIHTACGLINFQKPQSEKYFILEGKIEHSVNVQTGERILKSLSQMGQKLFSPQVTLIEKEPLRIHV